MSFSDFLDASQKTLTKNKIINSLCFDYLDRKHTSELQSRP